MKQRITLCHNTSRRMPTPACSRTTPSLTFWSGTASPRSTLRPPTCASSRSSGRGVDDVNRAAALGFDALHLERRRPLRRPGAAFVAKGGHRLLPRRAARTPSRSPAPTRSPSLGLSNEALLAVCAGAPVEASLPSSSSTSGRPTCSMASTLQRSWTRGCARRSSRRWAARSRAATVSWGSTASSSASWGLRFKVELPLLIQLRPALGRHRLAQKLHAPAGRVGEHLRDRGALSAWQVLGADRAVEGARHAPSASAGFCTSRSVGTPSCGSSRGAISMRMLAASYVAQHKRRRDAELRSGARTHSVSKAAAQGPARSTACPSPEATRSENPSS